MLCRELQSDTTDLCLFKVAMKISVFHPKIFTKRQGWVVSIVTLESKMLIISLYIDVRYREVLLNLHVMIKIEKKRIKKFFIGYH